MTPALAQHIPFDARLSVAPMMDWTDRHCRMFHRAFSRRAWLYSEMVTAAAVIHGPKDRLLAYSGGEHPVVLQLGGSDPAELAHAVRIAAPYGYDEVNLNVGCPSDRVQSGCFGAVLMLQPALVAAFFAAMTRSRAALFLASVNAGILNVCNPASAFQITGESIVAQFWTHPTSPRNLYLPLRLCG
jgi:tRNA dihydrouridine synthase A